MYLLTSVDRGRTFHGESVSKWNIGACVMSSEAFAQQKDITLAAWETEKQVYFGKINGNTVPQSIGAPGKGENRKYPALAMNSKGETLLAWTEGTARKKGGTLAWQLYNSNLQPEGATGKADGSPVWSFPAVFARPDGTFAGSTKRPRAWPASPAVPRLQPAFLALRSATARSPDRRPSHP